MRSVPTQIRTCVPISKTVFITNFSNLVSKRNDRIALLSVYCTWQLSVTQDSVVLFVNKSCHLRKIKNLKSKIFACIFLHKIQACCREVCQCLAFRFLQKQQKSWAPQKVNVVVHLLSYFTFSDGQNVRYQKKFCIFSIFTNFEMAFNYFRTNAQSIS